MVQDLLPSGYSSCAKSVFNGIVQRSDRGVDRWARSATAPRQTLRVTGTVLATGSYTNTATQDRVDAEQIRTPPTTASSASVTPAARPTSQISKTIFSNPTPTIGEKRDPVHDHGDQAGPGNAAGWWCRTCCRRATVRVRRSYSMAAYNEVDRGMVDGQCRQRLHGRRST